MILDVEIKNINAMDTKLVKLIIPHTNYYWSEYHRIREEQIFHHTNVMYNKNHPTLFSSKHRHMIFLENDIVIGIAHIEFLNTIEVAMRSIAIDKSYQSKGYGTKLIKLLEKLIKENGYYRIKLHAALSAEHFYRKLGYNNITWNDIGISPDSINLGKDL